VLRCRADAEASFGWRRQRPFDPALRDLRMHRAVARLTSRRTPRWARLAELGGGIFVRAGIGRNACAMILRGGRHWTFVQVTARIFS
jgi:hypothetical protein